MTTPAEMIAVFRSAGRKITPQRARVFQALADNPSHPTAESVYEAVVADVRTVSLKTVYTTLHEMAELGVLRSLDMGTGSRRFDPNVSDHHHLVCDECGSIADLDAEFPGVDLLPDNDHGFVVTAKEIVFRGRCHVCVAAG
jgi:Fe2+ or Zn2+ uptake regulation protein